VESKVPSKGTKLTVYMGLREPARPNPGELLLNLALTSTDDRREHVDPRVLRIQHHHVDDPLERLARDLFATLRAMRNADIREEQPQVVVDLCHRADRRARVRSRCLLLD